MDLKEIMQMNMRILMAQSINLKDSKISMLQYCLRNHKIIAWKVMNYNHFSESKKPFEKRDIYETKFDECQIEKDLESFIDTYGSYHS